MINKYKPDMIDHISACNSVGKHWVKESEQRRTATNQALVITEAKLFTYGNLQKY